MRIRGRKEIFPYALFEALKVRDLGSNRYLITVFITAIRKDSKPQRGAEKFEAIKYKYILAFR